MIRPAFSVIVTNWEGEAWIARTLSSLQLSARATGLPYELIVVDDASTDGSVPIVRESFPRVRLLTNRDNLGFGESTMRGVREATSPVLVLCNNDLVANEKFLPNLVRWFRRRTILIDGGKSSVPRKRLFGVSARTVSWFDGKPNQLCMGARFRGGRITPSWSDPKSATRCLFVQAGAAAYDRAAFLKLGGLWTGFSPGYWEDYDLSYRAAKAGYVNLYDPDALALHHGGGSMMRRFGVDAVEALRARNHLLFEWRNLSDGGLLARHAARLAVSVGCEWMGGRRPLLTRALADALPHVPAVLRARSLRRQRQSDAFLFKEYGTGTPSF